MEIVRSEHELKIEGLARFVLSKKTKEERRKFLNAFEDKHGSRMADELKDRIHELHKASLGPSAPDKPR